MDKQELKDAIKWLNSIEVNSEWEASCRLWTITTLEELKNKE